MTDKKNGIVYPLDVELLKYNLKDNAYEYVETDRDVYASKRFECHNELEAGIYHCHYIKLEFPNIPMGDGFLKREFADILIIIDEEKTAYIKEDPYYNTKVETDFYQWHEVQGMSIKDTVLLLQL